jgi:hypothetical protein
MKVLGGMAAVVVIAVNLLITLAFLRWFFG